jgi:photosystem II stability/assembly factor-like uncharacterized protein
MPATSSHRQLFLLLLVPLVLSVPLHAIDGQWRNLGPDGGSVYSLAVQPDDSRVMYAGVDGGVYKSVDGGASWSWAGEGLGLVEPVTSLAIDAVRASTLYAAQGQGVYKSVDGGQTWTRTGPPGVFTVAAHPRTSGTVFAATTQGLYRTSNGGTRWKQLTRGLPRHYRAKTVLIDPTVPNRIYAVVEDIDSLQDGIFKSTDGGNSWRSANRGLLREDVNVVTLDRQAPETLYAGTADAVFKSTNGGATWKTTGLSDVGLVASLTVHPEPSDVVYAGTASGLFRSRDGGVTWSRLSQGLPEAGVVNVLAFPSASPQTIFAGVSVLVGPGGVFRSADEGGAWVLSSHGLSTLDISSVAVDPQTRDTLWIVAGTTLFKSTDGGATWARAFTGDLFPHRVVVDPFDSSIVYVVFTNSRLGRTRDGGRSWEILDRPLGATDRIVADPQTPSTLYAAGLGFAKSLDRGATWIQQPGPLFDLFCHVLAISPSEPSTLYASGASSLLHAIVRTMDGGTTWTPIQQGLPALPLSFAIDPSDPMTAFTSFAGDIYRTTGGEATWERISKAFHDRLAHPLTMSDAGTLYAAVWYDNVYASEGGVEWSPLGASPTHSAYTALAVDPLNPCRIYAGTSNRGLLVFTKTGTAECN